MTRAKPLPIALVLMLALTGIDAGRRAAALVAALNGFKDRYHDQTACAQGYIVTDCRNTLPVQAPE